MVLLLLAVLWAAVLTPAFLRNRAESRSADSIGDFRRQLGVLQRTGPNLVRPANRLRLGEARPANAVPLRSTASPYGERESVAGYGYGHPQRPATSRTRSQRRRRDVLLMLLGGFGVTLLGGVVMHTLWALTAVIAVASLAYMAMLVRMRQVTAEREMKLAYLPRPAPMPSPEPAMLLRRSVN